MKIICNNREVFIPFHFLSIIYLLFKKERLIMFSFYKGTLNISKSDQTPLVENTDDVIIEEEENEEEPKKFSESSSSSSSAKFTSKEKVYRLESGKFKSDISESSLNCIPELQITERLLQVCFSDSINTPYKKD